MAATADRHFSGAFGVSTFDRIEGSYEYTAFQQGQGDNSFPGVKLDADLQELRDKVNEAFDILDGVVRSDGMLANGIVEKSNLSPDILLGVPTPRPWATATAYEDGDAVSFLNGIYLCSADHTSGVFATDLAAGRWELLVEFAVDTSILDGAVTTPKLANEAVTPDKLAAGAVGTAKLADQAVTPDKLLPTIGTLPLGAVVDFSGVIAPSKFLLCHGQAISRATFEAVFPVLCPAFACTVTNSSNVIAAASSMAGLGLVGAVVEGPGIPAGAKVASVSGANVTLDAVATVTTVGAQVRFFPHGNGDGVTTFTMPDYRDRVNVGRGDMGGAAATVLDASLWPSTQLGRSGGAAKVTLAETEIPAHTHSGNTVAAGAHNHSTAMNLANSANTDSGGFADFKRPQAVAGTTGAVGDHTHSFVTAAAGGGQAHGNVQPFRVTNKIMFVGA
jgi:microcystin-dependent protein